jgi:two-component system chemotaxis sensor kinase CheA
VRSGGSHAEILQAVHGLKLEPSHRRMDHFAEQARRIAARLDKSVDVKVDGGGLRIDPQHWGPFWSAFIHAVRNAVDHGLEATELRVGAGKPERGHLSLRTFMRAGRFIVEIADDGPGIDWPRVARKASELGLPAGNPEELRSALFHDGVSTAAQVTDISGRGIGMGAVRAATESLGGQIEIETRPGGGTSLRMVFPAAAMTPDLSAQRRTAAA